ncbi:MAG TPA: DctP family TRAP transporter solute-binding subunit [Xanthobacteraceae bacterium]|nr:DctP family TRAP transporter solute-binding subunit [Xanthobacteraceae bacterium]
MRPRLSFAAAAALLAVALGAPAAAQEHVLRIGFLFTKDSQLGAGAKRMAAEVAKQTGGRYRIEMYPNAAAGGEVEMIRDVQLGHLDIGFITNAPFSGIIPEMGIFDVAFLFRDAEHAHHTLDGPIGDEYLAKFKGYRMVGLAWGENGMRHITNSKRPIDRPEDLNGLKMRVPQSPVMIAAFKALGADAQPLAFPALYGALQTRQFDGEENPLAVIIATHFERVQKYLTLSGHVYSWAAIVMSPQAWEALSEEDQRIFVAAAKAGGAESRVAAAKAEAEGVDMLKKTGMQVVTSVDRAAFEKAAQPASAEAAKQFGEKTIERIRAVK